MYDEVLREEEVLEAAGGLLGAEDGAFGEEGSEPVFPDKPEKIFFQGLIGHKRFKELSEDFWEEEGIGWK